MVKCTAMADGDAADCQITTRAYKGETQGLAARVIDQLHRLRNYRYGYQVNRFEHCLQTATRAQRAGADEETIVCALVHDIGDDLAPHSHGDYAAAILRPYITAENHWMIQHHRTFQGYHFFQFMGQDRNERDKYKGHPAYERTIHFCDQWDQAAFDPNYDTMALQAFAPM
ncbi:MAG: HD domain-containing protein, partial [Alphaproteobacteria bacterium]|nr:HD domain-containing protein [Alphaproteobacteria bacterium]